MTTRALALLLTITSLCSETLAAQTPALAVLQRVGEVTLPADVTNITFGSIGAKGTLALAIGNREPFLLIDSTLKNSISVDGKRSPGEMREVTSLLWTGDSLGALDGGLRRVSFYQIDGKLTGVFGLGSWSTSSSPIAPLGNNYWLVQRVVRANANNPNAPATIDSFSVAVTKAGEATSRDLVVKGFESQIITLKGSKTMLMMPQPGVAPPLVAAARMTPGIVLMDSSNPDASANSVISIKWVSTDGTTLQTRSATFPVALNSRDQYIGSLLTNMDKSRAENGSLPLEAEIRDEMNRKLHVPPFVAPLSWLQVDRRGDAWFTVRKPASTSSSICRAPMQNGAITCADIPTGMTPVAADIGGRLLLKETVTGKAVLHEYRMN